MCLVAAAGLILAGATAQNGTQARQGHQRAGHGRVRLLAALAPESWSGATGRWSGYVVKGRSNNEVAATFTVSTLSCQSGQDGVGTALWVGIQSTDSNGTPTIVQDGIGYRCGTGWPQYWAWMVPDAHSQQISALGDPVQPGDRISADVFEFGSVYWMILEDPVENWWAIKTVTGGAASSNMAAVAAESFDGGAYFDPVAVTGAQVNDLPLGQSSPEADEEGTGFFNGTAGLDPSGLDASGQNFNFSWNGTPGLASASMPSGQLNPVTFTCPFPGWTSGADGCG